MLKNIFRRNRRFSYGIEKRKLTKQELLSIIEKARIEGATELDLSNSGVRDLPAEIWTLSDLQSLSLHGNEELSKISPEIGNLINLRSLNLGYTRLSQYPREIWNLKSLEELDLSGNNHKRLPSEIGCLTSLQRLKLDFNKSDSLPKEILKLSNLTELDLSYGHLKAFPIEITKLRNLKTLDLKENRSMLEVPNEIGHLTQLESLNLSDTGLSKLPLEIGELTQLKYLAISENNLADLPNEIGKLTNLENLDLRKNQLSHLNPNIGKLYTLQVLLLSDNHLSSLPSDVDELIQLEYLDLASNKFINLPLALTRLERLKALLIANNQIIELPKEISRLKNLSILTISGNAFSSLPPEIGDLSDLEILIMSRADEKEITVEIQHKIVSKVSGFSHSNWFSHGDIWEYGDEKKGASSLPKEILLLKKLKILDLRSNRLPVPPEILSKIDEPQTLLNYYFSVIEGNRKPINEVKLIIVGQGSVGKTSLVEQILHGTFDPSQTKTEGISINQWRVYDSLEPGKSNHKKEDSRFTNSKSQIKRPDSFIRLNIWDFGGQEIMHATHQFFLSKRSLYLLVLDARLTQEENRVEYWLKIIQSFGGESPVLIVGNKTDQHPLDIDRTGLQKKYPNIVGVLATSAATGAGIKALKAVIVKQLASLPHVRDVLPEEWYKIKSALEELGRKKNFITQDEYLRLCNTNHVTDEISQRTLIGFLHDLGVVLHYQDEPRLEALGILNPQWVTNGVYKILNSRELFYNQGMLTLPILTKVLDLPEYPGDKRLFIVDMMKKFELCYDIEPDRSFLIPDLLPKDEPFTGEWDGALYFQYHYSVLPSSIITRFIVRMNPFIHKTIWRSGVVLKSESNTALIKADNEDRKISIWVMGDTSTRRDFLSAIRIEFEAIHKSMAKIEVTEKIPLPNYPSAEPVDYRLLLQMEQEGIDTHHVQAASELVAVNVRELLDGIRPPKNQAVKVFISYAHKDKVFAKKLASELGGEGMKVWWDFDSLKGGQDWQKEIERGIKQCDFFLVVMTPDAVSSEWVGNEITYAALAQKKIIPLHLKNCAIPIGLIKKQYIDFEKQTQEAALAELKELLRTQATNT